MAGRIDFVIEQGSTFRRPFIWKTGEPLEPVILAGYTARLQAYVAGVKVLELTTENGGIYFDDAVDGKVWLYIPLDGVDAIRWREASHVIEFVAPNGDTRRLLRGKLLYSPEGG